METKKNKRILTLSLSLVLGLIVILLTIFLALKIITKKPNVELDKRGLPIYKKPVKKTVDNADYYVSIKSGDDNFEGSINKPFKTITKAQEVIRSLIKTNSPKINKDLTIAIMGGEYNFREGLIFNTLDNLPNKHRLTYTSYNYEEVIFSGGLNIKASEFRELSSNDLVRINDTAKNNVRVVNLFDLGLNQNTIGKLYSMGRYSQGKKYGEDNGLQTELFYDHKKMQLARYPNNDFAKIGQVTDYGQAQEHVPDIIDWNNTPSPRPPKFLTDELIKERMKSWQKPTSPLNSIWAYGYFYWDWADCSSPITNYDSTTGEISLKYSNPYGIKEGGSYYLYNILEELDSLGEYYIDRATGNLYVYFPEGYNKDSLITMSLINESLITMNKTNNITIDGISLEYSRSNAIKINGTNNIISNSIIKNIAQNGIEVSGKQNIISDNEIKNIGKNGLIVGNSINYKEGNIENDLRKNGLRLENNLIKNNYIHNYGENTKTGIAGISIQGVGNKITNNEIFDSPFTGILYAGNEHLIEYNYLHHVVKESSDAGAIYSGRNLSYYGNVIRYNIIADIGSNKFTPNGIYFDDCLAGQVAYANLLVNIPGNGFLIGGGRDHVIYDNVIINAKDPIRYDARAYDGLTDGWYKKNVETPNSRMWHLLNDAKKLYQNWLSDSESKIIMDKSLAKYKKIMEMLGYDNKSEPNSAATPNGEVFNNIIISKNKHLGVISDITKKYGIIKDNNTYDDSDQVKQNFKDFKNGNYLINKGSIIAKENKNYNKIPYHLIGRINN